MAEFDLIGRLARAIPGQGPGVELGIGDDAAILSPAPGQRLVVATDTLNENIHFLPDVHAADLGHKALAVNLSDLAAMGAEPRWVLMNLTLPGADEAWLDDFAEGFAALALSHGVSLVGGDTCQGPLSVTVTVLGNLPASGGLQRDGARAGDLVLVSGNLGDAALALNRRRADKPVEPHLAAAMDRPVPRLELGQGVLRLASACIDLSDGLLADLGHVARASGLGAVLDTGALPGSTALQGLPRNQRWNLQLCGGDDYELCFTVPPERRDEALSLGETHGLPLSVVGHMTEGKDVVCKGPDGAPFQPRALGWEHFRGTGLPDD